VNLRARLLVLLGAGAIAAAGCGGPRGAERTTSASAIELGSQPAAEQVLTRSLDDSPSTLDPALATDVYSEEIFDDLFEGLTTLSADGHAVPGVASSWEVSADALTWVFHLRPGARWSNGAPLTAQDFVYGWRRTVDPKTAAAYAQGFAPVLNSLEVVRGQRPVTDLGIDAVDAHTVRVRLSTPTPYLPYLLTKAWTYPLYQPVVSRYGDDWTRPEHIVSNGPFTLQEYVLGNRVTLLRNPLYWDVAHVRLERVIFYIITDRDAAARRYLAGQVEWVNTFPTPDRPWLTQQLGDQVVVAPYFSTFMIGTNSLRGPVAHNRALRMALMLGFDRDMVVQHVLFGAGYAAVNLMPPLEGYTPQIPDWAKLSTAQRYELARRYYHEAGYSRARPLRMELVIPSGDPVTTLTYEAVVAMWRTVLGAEITLHEEEFRILLQDDQLHKSLLFHNAWVGDYPDPFTFMQLFVTGFDLNYGAYSNPQYDALVQRAAAVGDVAERYRLFEQAERLIDDEGVNIPIYYYSVRHLIKPYVKGWVANSSDRNPSRYMYLLEHRGS
jgi:oligopeptide transport system substrate-binding protein